MAQTGVAIVDEEVIRLYFVGVDLGTSSVKLLAMDASGAVVKTVSRSYPLYIEANGNSEQDPQDWWEAVKEGLSELTRAVDPTQIQAVSFSGQMHGLVTLDAEDHVLRRAILWNDQRTVPQCEKLNNSPEVGTKRLLDHVANIALTGFTLPKILWMKEQEPDLFAKIAKIMLPKDYLAYRLSGVFATDCSDASGMLLLDVKNKSYSQWMLDLAGIREEQLPKLYQSFDCIGRVTDEASKATGLAPGTKIVIGGGDQAVGAVGTGTIEDGACSISIGSSGVVFVAMDDCKIDYQPSALHSFCHANGRYHMMGVTLSAATSNTWWIQSVLQENNYAKLEGAIAHPEQNNLIFLPYLTGERSPINDPNARGTFIGMTPNTTREEMTLAMFEGVAFSLRQILERMQALGVSVKRARIIGGGAKSPLWRQVVADVLGITIERINANEGAAFGAAILAAVGSGEPAFASLEATTKQLICAKDECRPNEQLRAHYDQKYALYLKTYQALRPVFEEMQSLVTE